MKRLDKEWHRYKKKNLEHAAKDKDLEGELESLNIARGIERMDRQGSGRDFVPQRVVRRRAGEQPTLWRELNKEKAKFEEVAKKWEEERGALLCTQKELSMALSDKDVEGELESLNRAWGIERMDRQRKGRGFAPQRVIRRREGEQPTLWRGAQKGKGQL